MKKWMIVILGMIAVSALVFVIVGNQGPRTETKLLKTIKVREGTIVDKALAIGELAFDYEIAIKAKVTGDVAKVFIKEGDVVRAGMPLIKIKPDPSPMEFVQAKRNLEIRTHHLDNRTTEFRRGEALLQQGIISQADFDIVLENYRRAKIERDLANEELEILVQGKATIAGKSVESVVYSPISGSVVRLNVNVGDPVVPLTSFQPGTALMYIADVSKIMFNGTVDEIDIGRIREGMVAEIDIGALPGTTISGRLSKIALKSEKRDNATVFAVDIDDLEIPEGIVLRAGYSANANIIVERVEKILIIPERVVTFRDDSTFVYLPKEQAGELEERYITTGISDGINVELISGLVAGEDVIDDEVAKSN